MDHYKINLFVIGASKCGSTYLHNLLCQHPHICMSAVKEPWFFSAEDYEQKMEWYLSLFEHHDGEKYAGESSPIYSETTYFPEIPQRIYRFNPNAKLIYIVREPFSRLESVYKQTMSTGHWAEKKFYHMLMPTKYSEAVFSYPPYLEATKYWTHIQSYLRFFSKNQIHVIMFDDLIHDTQATLHKITEFLDLPAAEFDIETASRNESAGKKLYNKHYHRVKKLLPGSIKNSIPQALKVRLRIKMQALSSDVPKKPVLTETDRQKIKDILTPEVRELYAYLGVEDDPWNFFGES